MLTASILSPTNASIVKLDNLLYHRLHSPLSLYPTLFTLLTYMLAVFKLTLKTKYQFLQPVSTPAAIYISNTKLHNLLFKYHPQPLLYSTMLFNPWKYLPLFFNLISNPQFMQIAPKHNAHLYAPHSYYMLYFKQIQLNLLFIFRYHIKADRYNILTASHFIHCNCHPEIYVSARQTTYSSIHSHKKTLINTPTLSAA